MQNYKKCATDISGVSTTFLDSSTVDIPTSIEVHKYVKQQIPDFDFIDTPVSGGVAGSHVRERYPSCCREKPTRICLLP